ncbi:hypothetical protein LEMLEM_LOCUS25929 [Lemmus lemmus]
MGGWASVCAFWVPAVLGLLLASSFCEGSPSTMTEGKLRHTTALRLNHPLMSLQSVFPTLRKSI